MVTKLDRLTRSLPDARAIAEDLTTRKASGQTLVSAYSAQIGDAMIVDSARACST